ncbi:MAG: alpha/beta hydrolase [Treponema sp.]|nr:alpha/beta hydrolase [Treponema sp.]
MKLWPSLAPYARRLVLPGGELFFYDSGGPAQKPAIMLIHGLGDEADTWRHIFLPLAEHGYRVIAPDMPGFGRSRWKGRINVSRHASAVVSLLEASCAASPENPAVLIGSSMGSGIAELAAFKRPDLAKTLILLDGCFPFSGGLPRGFLLAALPFAGKRWYRSFRINHEGAWRSLYPYYNNLEAMSGEDRAFLRERVIARVESASQERGYFASLRSLNAVSLFARSVYARRMKKFPGNVLLLWGGADRIFPVEKAAAFRSLRPGTALTPIADAGHLPQQEKPDETASAILDFLKTPDDSV